MTQSGPLSSKKFIVSAALVIAVALAGLAVFLPSSATAQQTTMPDNNMQGGGGGAGGGWKPSISGSINVPQMIQDSIKVSFSDAASTAEKQVDGGTVVGGHLGMVQGYLVYTFSVVNSNQTAYMVLVDAGNGQVLYTSQGHHTMGSFGHNMLGHGQGQWKMMPSFGGMWNLKKGGMMMMQQHMHNGTSMPETATNNAGSGSQT